MIIENQGKILDAPVVPTAPIERQLFCMSTCPLRLEMLTPSASTTYLEMLIHV